MSKQVLILMGSDSDFDLMLPAVRTLKEFGVGCDVRVLSVHRAPDLALATASKARGDGYRIIIAAAGGAAHLAGAVAAKTTLPVIGVPIENGALKGLDALYSTVQMPPGVPVATVGINASQNAALLAVEILGLADERIAADYASYKAGLVEKVLAKDRKVQGKLKDEQLG